MGLNPTASSTQVTRIRLAATVCKTVLFGVNIAGSNPAACTSLTCPENGQLLRGSRKGGRRAHNPETRIVTGDRNQVWPCSLTLGRLPVEENGAG